MTKLYLDVVGQERAVAALRVAAVRPVHAYLLVGPAGTGKRAAATSFAAQLLCPAGGDGTCDVCRRVLAGAHPDVVVVEREGAAITVDMARDIGRAAARSPVEGRRKVLVLHDFQLVKEAGPALLKTIEEPPPSTVFVILAEHVPYELVTIASRCVRIDFSPLAPSVIAAALRADGVSAEQADELAVAADGRLDRARLLAADPEFGVRRRAWQAIPERLDGAGATAAAIADELIGLLEHSVTPLRARQDEEVANLKERNARMSEVNGKTPRGRAGAQPGLRELEERHKREVRRQRTDELRAGLAALAVAYRDQLAAGGSGAADAVAAVGIIQKLNENLVYNPSEQLQLQALLVGLGRLAGMRTATGSTSGS
jgi:DNA polymerase III subunit delta'